MAEMPEEAVEAVSTAIKTRCCSFSDGGDGSGWADRQYRRVAAEVLQAAYPAIRSQVEREVRERLAERFTPEFVEAFNAALPGVVRHSTLDTIVALRAATSNQGTQGGE